MCETEDKARNDKLTSFELFSFITLKNIKSARQVAKHAKTDSRLREWCITKGMHWAKEVAGLIALNDQMNDCEYSLIDYCLIAFLEWVETADTFLDLEDEAAAEVKLEEEPPVFIKQEPADSQPDDNDDPMCVDADDGGGSDPGSNPGSTTPRRRHRGCGCGYYDSWHRCVDMQEGINAHDFAEDLVCWAIKGRVRGNWIMITGPAGTCKSYTTAFPFKELLGEQFYSGPSSNKGSYPQERLGEDPVVKAFLIDESTCGTLAGIFGEGTDFLAQ